MVSSVLTLTAEQVQQLLMLLPSANSHPLPNFAGTLFSFSTLHSSMWIIDTGATDHMISDIYLFFAHSTISSSMHLPNGSSVPVTHVGKVSLFIHITLTNMLCVPSFRYNLLYVSKLFSQSNCLVSFIHDGCTF